MRVSEHHTFNILCRGPRRISEELLSYAAVKLITSKITYKKLTSLTIEGLDVSPWARQVKSAQLSQFPIFENAYFKKTTTKKNNS
jgi:hypothetical protein